MDDIAVDYTSTGYLDKHLGISSKGYDATIVRAMFTRRLIIYDDTPLLALYSTALFRQLRHLEFQYDSDHRILILPYLEQIEKLEIMNGTIPDYSSNLNLPLTHTLQYLGQSVSTSSWMLGRTFKALREFSAMSVSFVGPENHSRHEGLQVDLPACTTLDLTFCAIEYLHFLSCSNVQNLRWAQHPYDTFDLAVFNSIHNILLNLSCLQNLDIFASQGLGIDSLIDFVFCGAPEHGVWREIRTVEVKIEFNQILDRHSSEASDFIDQRVGHQPRYEKWWKSFTVTRRDSDTVTINASM